MCPSHQIDFTGAPWEWSSRDKQAREEYFIEAMNLGGAQHTDRARLCGGDVMDRNLSRVNSFVLGLQQKKDA